MRKINILCVLTAILLLPCHQGFSQTYILNEDFTSANDTIPPVQWSNSSNTATATDLWHFDNPGNRVLDYPVSGQFAIFDSENYSQNGILDEAILESPSFDASIGNYIFLFFDHRFTGQSGDTGFVEVFDGALWQQVVIFTDTTTNPASEMFDVSSQMGGISNAKLRFRWKGDGANYWAIDNISVFAPLVVDLGILDLAQPQMPFLSGVNNIELDLKNFGAINITNATIQWELNGVLQTPFAWTGNIGFTDTATNVIIGSHNFVSGQPVAIKAWVENPNNTFDANPLNDTLEIDLAASLCGTYTIGGSTPDFQNFTEAVTILNNAGVSCPVLFLVRDGMYDEQIEIGSISGANSVNTVTFRGESLDSAAVTLDYTTSNSVLNYTLNLNSTSWIRFEHLTFQRIGTWNGRIVTLNNGSHNIRFSSCQILNNRYGLEATFGTKNIVIEKCRFTGNMDYGVYIIGNSSDTYATSGFNIKNCYINVGNNGLQVQHCAYVDIRNNHMEGTGYMACQSSYCIGLTIYNNDFNTNNRVIHLSNTDSIKVYNNTSSNSGNYALYIAGNLNSCQVWSNRFLNVTNANGVELKAPNIRFFNNFVSLAGISEANGITTNSSSDNNQILFNSISINNNNSQSSAIWLAEADNLDIKNNIFANNSGGFAIKMPTQPTGLVLNYNDYFTTGMDLALSPTTNHQELSAWQTATNLDANSLEANPFYPSNTDLSCHQILLDGMASPNPLITVDIDSTLRATLPDMGAQEFSPCAVDAGINDLPGLVNPMSAGSQNIEVVLQNQGTTTLSSCTIHWTVNGTAQADFAWVGSLASAQNALVSIGSFNFQAGNNYDIQAWTSAPNGQVDCDNFNDTTTINDLSTPLCGTYYIGGSNPDFVNFSEAVTVLNNAGISCSVLFLVRDGIYQEQIEIGAITGADSANTVTFRGESLDSTLAILDYTTNNTVLNYTLKLNASAWIRFEHMTIRRIGSWGAKIVQLSNYTHNIKFSSCRIIDNRFGIEATYGTQNIDIDKCRFDGNMDYGIYIYGNNTDLYATSGYQITNCYFSTDNYGLQMERCAYVDFTNNYLEGIGYTACYSSQSIGINISYNTFINNNRGIYLTNTDSTNVYNNTCSNTSSYAFYTSGSQNSCQVWGNRFLNVNNANGVEIKAPNTHFFNNFVIITGIGQTNGIFTNQNSDNCQILFNSINVVNNNPETSAIWIGEADNLDVRNNIFANNGGGFAVKMPTQPSGIDLDYNGYFSSGFELLQTASTNHQQLSSWQTATGTDANSEIANPFYPSGTDLSCHQILLNGMALPNPQISVDIDSTLRATPPDIGAQEFTICAVDAGINDLPGLTNPMSAGNQNISVVLQNHGTSTLTSCTIEWTMNGLAQPSFAWTGNLASSQNTQVIIGSFNFLSGINHNIRAWTSNPNNQTDCDNYNDTTILADLSAPLCGTYTIGGTMPNFVNFTEAVTVLNNAGVSCPVLFLIRDGIYDEQIEIGSIPGADSINTVTFRGESLDSTLAILDYTTSNSVLNYTVNLNEAAWLRFEHMTVRRIGSWGARIIKLSNSSHHIKFSSCGILDNRFGVEASYGTNNIVIDKCRFTGNMDFGIYILGNSANIFATSDFTINNCYFNTDNYALQMDRCTYVDFTNNHVEGIGYTAYYSAYCLGINIGNNLFNNCNRGIYLHYTDSVDVYQNTLTDLNNYGIYINSAPTSCSVWSNRFLNIENANAAELVAGNVLFYNNFIHTTGIASKSGIYTTHNSDNCKILFNTINIANTNALSAGITIGNADNLQIRNNIFANNGGGYAVIMPTTPSGLQLDYNNYFTVGNQLAQHNSTDYQQLSAWQAATLMDANSINYNPFYESDTELRPYQREINGAGIPIVGILLDIDGQIRDENAPDIGADEFMVDFGITEMLSPDLHCALTANDSVSISLKQFGDIPFNNIQLAYQVNGGTIFTDIVTGSINNDITFTFSQTQNLAGYGTYVFKIWIINSFDDNVNNDTLTIERYSNPVPQISVSQTTGCAGTPVQFTANATVALGNIGGYAWDFGDATVDSVQNPSHLYDTSGTYNVHLYAFSDLGCYHDTLFQSAVLTTPQADFEGDNICFGDTVFFTNQSTVTSGNIAYQWDFGNTNTSTQANPMEIYSASGTYNVMLVATGTNACADTIYKDIIVHAPPTLSFLNLPSSFCSNDTALQLAISPAGATVTASAYSNGWYYPASGNIGANNLMMTYIDTFGCSDTLIETIDILQAPTAGISGLANQYCVTGFDPSITGTPAGGVFSGNGISANQFSISDAGIGTHQIDYSYTAANGCTDIASQTVNVAQLNQFNFTFDVDSVDCFNAQTAAIDLTVYFTQQNYNQIQWSNGASTEDLAALGSGMYSVTAVGPQGCVNSDSVYIANPDTLTVQHSIIDVDCHGNSTGSVNISGLGGQDPYQYLWSNTSTANLIQNLTAGNYSVTLTDNLGCMAFETLSVNEPSSALSISPTIGDVACYGEATGTVSVNGIGGTSPYTVVAWSNGETSNTATNLSAGTYSVTLADANTCTESLSVTVSQPTAPLNSQLSASNISCFGDQNGAIASTISGGTPPYNNFTWSNGASTADINSLLAGTYSLSVYDHNNCMDTVSIQITEPTDLSASFAITDLLCFGVHTGIVQTTVSGASPPYTSFVWSNGEITQNLQNMNSGNYTLSVTDANSCEFTFTATVNSPADLSFDFTYTEPLCFDDQNGAIDFEPSGATPPYHSISWSTGANTEDLTNLTAGSYQVSISDANNCSFVGNAILEQPDEITFRYQLTDVLCHGESNGAIDLTISGGVPPYPFIHWSNGETGEHLTGLSAGSYQITVRDQNSCIQHGETIVSEPDILRFDTIVTHVLCYDDSDGAIEIIPVGGVSPYDLLWFDASTEDKIENLAPGNYALTLSDHNDCETKAVLIVDSPDDILVSTSYTELSCIFAEDASISVDVGGGTSPYGMDWSNGEQTDSLSNLAAGSYWLTLSDANNCQKEFEFIIDNSDVPCLDIPNVFTPNGDGINETWEISGMEFVSTCEIKVLDRWGRTVFESLGYPVAWDGKYDGELLPSDAYFYTIDYNNGHEPVTGKVSIVY